MATRPKEPRGRGGTARSSVQSGNAASSKMKRSEKYTSSEEDKRGDGHSGGRKTPQNSLKEEKSKNYATDECNPTTKKSTRKQRDTPAKKDKDNRTSPGGNDMIVQLTVNEYNGYSETAAEKEPSNKLDKSKSLDLETSDGAKDKSTIIKPQKLSHAKCKSIDEVCGNGKHQARGASGKKACDKISNQDKKDILTLESKRRGSKTASSKTPTRLIDLINDKLRLKMDDISKAAKKVNTVLDTILRSKEFQSDSLFKGIKKMSTGSYYEHVKISKPNEFDIMLEISLESFHTIYMTHLDRNGPFYTLAFKDRRPTAMSVYIDEQLNIIKASAIMKGFRDLISKIVEEMEHVTLQRKYPGSPAVTIVIKNEPQDISVDLVLALKMINRWPEETNDGLNINDWLGMKVKQEYKRTNFYMVAKQTMSGKKTLNADTWRISFSNIEKDILSNHGNGKTCCETGGSKREMCCRKQCLKLMKYLLELFKEDGKQKKMDQFCSYHAKTALLHHCANHPKDDDWKLEDLESCFNRYVNFFQECLMSYKLPNFFLPSHNLFSADSIDTSSCDYLYRKIEEQKPNYPIFND
ncbi:cyclic GMP-AMP synthase-like [Anomaloglossus baeobatrachus]|uniref:cyclic GMP-AMP synthase-like n=1 Tax=Anomaloglossus baeobatrachus TaxID=238106 RepID=UPI003F4F9526